MGYAVRVLADSVTTKVNETHRLTTMEVTLPRIVLAEFNTHRTFSRNSASSRAIPIEKRITMVELDPFIPEAFGRNQRGMQASEVLNDVESTQARQAWCEALTSAVRSARELAGLGVHKQLANRLIEPFCWQTIIVSATEWENFFALRCNPDAQPEIRRAADMMREAYDASVPKRLDPGMWHMPLLPDAIELVNAGFTVEEMCRISVGRCARVSYLTHDGERDPRADLELCARLQSSGHMSPFEHVARPLTHDDIEKMMMSKSGITGIDRLDLKPEEWFCGNFRGWMAYRKLIPGEAVFKPSMST